MAVYDDQKTDISDDDLRDITGISAEDEPREGSVRNQTSGVDNPNPNIQRGGFGSTKADLQQQEEDAPSSGIQRGGFGSTKAALADQEGGGLYHHEGEGAKGKAKGLRGRFKKLNSKRKKFIIAAGAAAVIGLVTLFFLAIFLGSLIIPNFAQSVITYQFARVTRETVATQAKQTAQKIAIDSAPDSVYQEFKNSIKAKGQPYYDKTFGKLDKWRPAKQMKNLATQGQLDFQYSEPKGVGSRVKLERVIVGGQGIDIPQNTYGAQAKLRYPISYIKDRVGTRQGLNAALKEAMPNSNFLVRAKVAKALRAKISSRLFRWSEDDKKKSNSSSKEKADIENAKQARKVATGSAAQVAEDAKSTGALSEESKKAIQDAVDAQNKCYGDDACVKKIINQGGGLSQEAAAAIESNVGESTFSAISKSVVSKVSVAYGVIVPVCLVQEGSTVNSEGTINNNSAEQERSFVGAASAADQQKAGAVSGEEVGAYARQLGQVGRSIPQQRASGVPVNTSSELSAQASAGGTYEANILTTIFGSVLGGLLSEPLKAICPVATNIGVGIAMIALEALPGINAGLTAAGEITAQTVTRVITAQMTNVVRSIFTKKTFTKITAQTVAIVGASWLARLIVMQHMGAMSDGSARGEAFDNQIDAGGNQYANDLDRQQNYAAPLTNKQVALLSPTDDQYRQQQFASQNFYQRYFAITNPGSLMNRLAVTTASFANLQSISTFVSSIPHFLNPVNMFSKLANLSHPFSRVAAAAESDTDTKNYGDIQWGWTAAEEAAFENNPEYQLFPNEEALGDKADDISSKYAHCFTDAIGTLLANQDLQRNEKGNILPDEGKCAPNNYSPTSSTTNPDGTVKLTFKDNDAALAFHWRVSMRYQNSMDESLNIQEVQSANQQL